MVVLRFTLDLDRRSDQCRTLVRSRGQGLGRTPHVLRRPRSTSVAAAIGTRRHIPSGWAAYLDNIGGRFALVHLPPTFCRIPRHCRQRAASSSRALHVAGGHGVTLPAESRNEKCVPLLGV